MRKIIQKKIRRSGKGINVVADVNAVVASSTGGSGGTAGATKRQSVSLVQRNGRTEVTESHSEE